LNESRLSYIKAAYDKLDVNKDGQVTLDDVAKLYDVSQHPDVLSGKCTPEEAYLNFMKMWDTQKADGIVTFDEFCTYFKDVSASIDTDEYFGVMMTNAWKL
jgi:calcyphosin